MITILNRLLNSPFKKKKWNQGKKAPKFYVYAIFDPMTDLTRECPQNRISYTYVVLMRQSHVHCIEYRTSTGVSIFIVRLFISLSLLSAVVIFMVAAMLVWPCVCDAHNRHACWTIIWFWFLFKQINVSASFERKHNRLMFKSWLIAIVQIVYRS